METVAAIKHRQQTGKELQSQNTPLFKVMLRMCDSLDVSQTSSPQTHPRATVHLLQGQVMVRRRLTTPSPKEGVQL